MPREQQQALSMAIEETIQQQKVLIAEAGTGTGKTFAYLIPALMSKKKVVISTGTKSLQDQLFYQDLPFLRKVLAAPIKIALLKGRANYLCKYRIENCLRTKTVLSQELLSQIEQIRATAPSTRFGETSEIKDIPEDSSVWPQVTSNADNCLGQDCEFYSDCYLVKARRRAMDADIVIVNHHLFFADLSLKQHDFGELLPKTEVFVLDEAHQLPDIAGQFFGERTTSRQLTELTRDTETEVQKIASDLNQVFQVIERLKIAIHTMRTALGEPGLRAPWVTVSAKADLKEAVLHLLDELTFFKEILEKAKERSKGIENCWMRASELCTQFLRLTGETPLDQIHWFEVFSQSFVLHFTPLSIAKEFQLHMNLQAQSWIFTSATLSVASDFTHYKEKMGLEEARSMTFNSPFDYEKQSLLYVPRGLPDPNHKNYTELMIMAILPVLAISKGRTFILFTSHSALKIASTIIEKHIEYPLLVQGTQPKSELLEQYKKLGNAVLLGTGSFWEGIDVRGEALSCVIIDKLPFTMPDDPVQKARSLALRKSGKNPFFVQQLPEATIMLKQGAGRLIRDIQDYGVLVICDPRIVAREYGRIFLQSLPSMPRTRYIEQVEYFFKQREESIKI